MALTMKTTVHQEVPPPCLLAAWHAHERELRAWLRGRLHEAQDAEDLLQDLFLKGLRQGRAFCELRDARAWWFTAARNALTDRLRLRREWEALPPELVAEADGRPPVATLADCLPKVLAGLSEADREAIVRCDLEGMTQARYARAQGLSLPGAKARVQRARQRLRARLTAACAVRLDSAGRVCCHSDTC
jgi:RNA polymerase sigma-70 factor (ECF subfamily)